MAEDEAKVLCQLNEYPAQSHSDLLISARKQ
jgi:hypothetical protein